MLRKPRVPARRRHNNTNRQTFDDRDADARAAEELIARRRSAEEKLAALPPPAAPPGTLSDDPLRFASGPRRQQRDAVIPQSSSTPNKISVSADLGAVNKRSSNPNTAAAGDGIQVHAAQSDFDNRPRKTVRLDPCPTFIASDDQPASSHQPTSEYFTRGATSRPSFRQSNNPGVCNVAIEQHRLFQRLSNPFQRPTSAARSGAPHRNGSSERICERKPILKGSNMEAMENQILLHQTQEWEEDHQVQLHCYTQQPIIQQLNHQVAATNNGQAAQLRCMGGDAGFVVRDAGTQMTPPNSLLTVGTDFSGYPKEETHSKIASADEDETTAADVETLTYDSSKDPRRASPCKLPASNLRARPAMAEEYPISNVPASGEFSWGNRSRQSPAPNPSPSQQQRDMAAALQMMNEAGDSPRSPQQQVFNVAFQGQGQQQQQEQDMSHQAVNPTTEGFGSVTPQPFAFGAGARQQQPQQVQQPQQLDQQQLQLQQQMQQPQQQQIQLQHQQEQEQLVNGEEPHKYNPLCACRYCARETRDYLHRRSSNGFNGMQDGQEEDIERDNEIGEALASLGIRREPPTRYNNPAPNQTFLPPETPTRKNKGKDPFEVFLETGWRDEGNGQQQPIAQPQQDTPPQGPPGVTPNVSATVEVATNAQGDFSQSLSENTSKDISNLSSSRLDWAATVVSERSSSVHSLGHQNEDEDEDGEGDGDGENWDEDRAGSCCGNSSSFNVPRTRSNRTDEGLDVSAASRRPTAEELMTAILNAQKANDVFGRMGIDFSSCWDPKAIQVLSGSLLGNNNRQSGNNRSGERSYASCCQQHQGDRLSNNQSCSDMAAHADNSCTNTLRGRSSQRWSASEGNIHDNDSVRQLYPPPGERDHSPMPCGSGSRSNGPSRSVDPTNLYFANLPKQVRDCDLVRLVEEFGPVISAKLMENPALKVKGVGFVRMRYAQDCEKVIRALNGKPFPGTRKILSVKLAWKSKDTDNVSMCAYPGYQPMGEYGYKAPGSYYPAAAPGYAQAGMAMAGGEPRHYGWGHETPYHAHMARSYGPAPGYYAQQATPAMTWAPTATTGVPNEGEMGQGWNGSGYNYPVPTSSSQTVEYLVPATASSDSNSTEPGTHPWGMWGGNAAASSPEQQNQGETEAAQALPVAVSSAPTVQVQVQSPVPAAVAPVQAMAAPMAAVAAVAAPTPTAQMYWTPAVAPMAAYPAAANPYYAPAQAAGYAMRPMPRYYAQPAPAASPYYAHPSMMQRPYVYAPMAYGMAAQPMRPEMYQMRADGDAKLREEHRTDNTSGDNMDMTASDMATTAQSMMSGEPSHQPMDDSDDSIDEGAQGNGHRTPRGPHTISKSRQQRESEQTWHSSGDGPRRQASGADKSVNSYDAKQRQWADMQRQMQYQRQMEMEARYGSDEVMQPAMAFNEVEEGQGDIPRASTMNATEKLRRDAEEIGAIAARQL